MKPRCFLRLLPLVLLTFSNSVLAVKVAENIKDKFERLSEACFGQVYANASFFPPAITKHATSQFEDSLHVSKVSFEKVASFLYSGSDLREASSGAMGRYFDFLDYENNGLIAPDSKYANLTYLFSCTSALKMGLDLDVKFPLYGVKAALKADAENKSDSGLTVLYGKFQTPISRAISSASNEERVRGTSSLWLSASKNPVGKYYLEYFEGWLLNGTTAQQAAQSLDASGQATVGALFLNADLSASAKLSYKSNFRSQDFDLFVVRGEDNLQNIKFVSIPSTQRIGAELAGVAVVNPSLVDAISGEQNKVRVAIQGLAKDLCTPNGEWDASASSGSVGVVEGAYDELRRTCYLTVPWSVAGASAQPASASIKLTNLGHKINGAQVSFSLSLQYQSASYPNIVPLTPRMEVVPGVSAFKVIAPVQWSLAPGTSESNVSAMGAKLVCTGRPDLNTQDVQYIEGKNPSLSVTFGVIGEGEVPESIRCLLTANVRFTVGDRKDIRQSLPFEVPFPARAPKGL